MLALTGVLQDAIETSRVYIISFVPVFASVLTACGQVGGAALYSGFFLRCGYGYGRYSVQSGAAAHACAAGAGNATAAVGSTDLSQLTASVCRWTKWLLTFCATVFGALIGLQGIFAQSADTLALKTGKFLLSSGVPLWDGQSPTQWAVCYGRIENAQRHSGVCGDRRHCGVVSAAAHTVLCVPPCVFRRETSWRRQRAATKRKSCFPASPDCVSLYISMVVFLA